MTRLEGRKEGRKERKEGKDGHSSGREEEACRRSSFGCSSAALRFCPPPLARSIDSRIDERGEARKTDARNGEKTSGAPGRKSLQTAAPGARGGPEW